MCYPYSCYISGLGREEVLESGFSSRRCKMFNSKFDTDKKILHNLISLLKTKQKQATGSESTAKQAVPNTLFFKNLTTDKCGRLE
jgi:hypothetical protein